MHALYYIFGALAGMCAFAFLLAGIMGFYDLERPRQNSSGTAWLLHVFSGGWFTFFRSVIRHWRTRADLRRLLYYALAALVIMTVLLYLGGCT